MDSSVVEEVDLIKKAEQYQCKERVQLQFSAIMVLQYSGLFMLLEQQDFPL
jgi:hypothetical protein